MLGFFPIGGDAIAGLGKREQLVLSFTNSESGGFVAGSQADSDASRWHTERIPSVWVVAGGVFGGGKANIGERWISDGGAYGGGKAHYPYRFVVTGGAVASGWAKEPTRYIGSGGAISSGEAIYLFGIGQRIGGGAVASGGTIFGYAGERYIASVFKKTGTMSITETTKRIRRTV